MGTSNVRPLDSAPKLHWQDETRAKEGATVLANKSNLNMMSLDGNNKTISADQIAGFRASLRGDILTRESKGYDESRSVWNSMIDKYPALVARCAGVADVMESVEFAARHELRLAVRGAGHNIAGTAICEGGLLIDLSSWRSVHVDPIRMIARVEPGATLGDIDHEAQAFGLATPTGVNSTTGIAGLTLGGGFGWLSRKHGLTIDNLRSADIVTADGTLRHCSSIENPALFWAIRGGGGNFGIVTSFEFDLHEIGSTILAGMVLHPFDKAKEVLQHYRRCVENMSDEMCVWMVSRKAPPLPFLPKKWHGKEVVILAACHIAEQTSAAKELEQLREWGEPIADVIGPRTFADWQSVFDPMLMAGARNYWKSHNLSELSDDAIEIIVDYGGRLPSEQSEILVARLGGAINRVAPNATAYPHRATQYAINLHPRWTDARDDDRCMRWAREFFTAMEPHATGGVYVNFIPNDEERVPNAYGQNLEQLRKLKQRYDPKNLFRINQNIRTHHAEPYPSGAARP